MSGLAARLALSAIAEIWSSEVPRALESAELIGTTLGVRIRTEARLNEMRLGPWEGLTEAEVAQRFPNEHAMWSTLPDRLVLAGRETLAAVAKRMCAAVDDAANERQPILLVSHVAPIRVAILAALDLPLDLYKRIHVDNGDAMIVAWHKSSVSRLGDERSLREEVLRSAETRSPA